MQLPDAEDVRYWRTGRSSPDIWIDKTRKIIEDDLGGSVEAEGFGRSDGQAAFMLQFTIDLQSFRVVWPVLPTRSGDDRAAKIQAATMLYHDCKARAISAAVLGPRIAFFQNLLLPNGKTAAQIADSDLAKLEPGTLLALPEGGNDD